MYKRSDGRDKKINFPIECLFVFSGDMRGGQDMVQDNVRLCALHWTLAAGFPPLVGDCCSYTQLCPGPGSRVVAYLTIPHNTSSTSLTEWLLPCYHSHSVAAVAVAARCS